MNKTAMQILRDKLKAEAKELYEYKDFHSKGYREALESIANDIDAQMLAIEKQQHLDTGTNCIEKYIKGDLILGENIAKQYFNQTFNPE
jgi:hypothetical protein